MKKVNSKNQLKFQPAFPGLKSVDIMERQFPIEPFLVFTEFVMNQPVFGPHPHAGVSVMTYMLPDSKGSFINRDSQGDYSLIEPGGMHITQAGRGIHHDEIPAVTGIDCHGFQIWINHLEQHRWVQPKAMHAKSIDIAESHNEYGLVRIIHGTFKGQEATLKMVTDVTLLHVFLRPGKVIQLDADEMAFVYGLHGSGSSGNENILPQSLLIYEEHGSTVEISGGATGLEFMFGTGKPLNEAIIYGGPFVMTTEKQMQETRLRYQRGEMGTLLPHQG